MPDITPAALSDIALATSTANAISVSRGAGQVPLADPNFAWNPSTRLHTLAGQAAGAGGDRWQLQNNAAGNMVKYDQNGSHVFNMLLNPAALATQLIPNEAGYPVNWNICNDVDPQVTGQGNGVASIGWNVGSLGQRVNLLQPTFRIGMENNYDANGNGSSYWMEGHILAFYSPVTGGETRPFTVQVVKDPAGYTTQGLFQGESWTWQNQGQTVQWAQLLATPSSGNIYFTVYGTGSSSSNGYALQLTSAGTSPQDTMTLGRKSASNNSLVIQGTSATWLDLATGGNTSTIINDGNLAIYGPTGGDINMRTPGYWRLQNGNGGVSYGVADPNGGIAFGLGGAAPNYGLFDYNKWQDGVGIVYLKNATTAPTLNPVGGSFLYSNAGVPTWRQSDGTVYALNNFARLSGASQTVSAASTFSSKLTGSAGVDVTADGSEILAYWRGRNGTNNNAQFEWIGGLNGLLWRTGTDVSTGSGLKTFEFFSAVKNATTVSMDATTGNTTFNYAIGVNGSAPPAKAASPGTASGTDAAVINAITAILRNVGFCS